MKQGHPCQRFVGLPSGGSPSLYNIWGLGYDGKFHSFCFIARLDKACQENRGKHTLLTFPRAGARNLPHFPLYTPVQEGKGYTVISEVASNETYW